jgi:hypothetical protein
MKRKKMTTAEKRAALLEMLNQLKKESGYQEPKPTRED